MSQRSQIPVDSLLSAIPTPFILLDEQLVALAANPAFYHLFSTTPAAIIDRPLADIDILAAFHADIQSAQQENAARDLESDALFTLIGRKVVVHLAPLPNESGSLPPIAISFDTTLLEFQRGDLFHDLLESAPDAMLIMNASGDIVLANAKAHSLFGFAEGELIGQPVELLVPRDFQAQHQRQRSNYAKKPHSRPMNSGLALRGLHRTGREFPVDISLSPIQTTIGLLVSITVRDVTKQINTETELRKALEKERELNELKSHFVTMVSHEFRTPLSGIHASAELIQNYSDRMTKERADQHLTQIQEGVRHLTVMLDEILTISKAQSVGLEFQPVLIDLRDFCQTLTAKMQSNTHHHQIILEFHGAFCHLVYADPKLLGQALTNLIMNAIKYSPEGGDIHFSVACDVSEIRFTVVDHGIGIPEADQQHLFEVFRRGTNVGRFPGTGLGLAIVRETLRAHHGSVALESQLGQGSVFTLTIPLVLTSAR